ncbi:zinc finger protein 664-like [Hyposmocoma kahamanoa]|uniref:zinc finger protein 664-like n=1 Tax=Hyposmocoma kahamanoa TaxID=1477025 RepID=UPI000E6D9282|nr:zinc finger protein 664-like [Hyposmocoma kahamanoa]
MLKRDAKAEVSNEISLSSCSKENINFVNEQTSPKRSKNPEELVKIEESTEFEPQNDFDNDFEPPVEYNESSSSSVNELKVFTCSCGNIYNKKDEYKTHLRENYCNGYKKATKIKVEKKNVMCGRNITIKQQIICPECNLEFDTMKACKLHRRKHKNESADDIEKFHCTLCMRKFNRKSSYTNHMKNHDIKSSVKFTCDTCKREFQHKAHLDNHILSVHTREKGYPCELCNTNFSTQESLDLHKESHKIEKKHQCKLCNKAFYMLSTLNDHMRTHTGEKPFLCSVCGRGFSQKTNLAQHMRRHQGLKPFKCDDCDRSFVSKGELVAHKRKHSGAHPFVCDECGSGFTTSSSLVKHRRTHTGERPYSCDLCPARFAASGTLKNHRRTHTGEKPFQCSYCEKAFVQRHDLISHIRCHTGERPFVCGCGQAFRKASALKAHVRMHAKESGSVIQGLTPC